MLDAIGCGAAVFEPEEVDVLAAACGLAMRKIGELAAAEPGIRAEIARLVHNLGRSRLRHKKRLKDATDAATLADEAVDLLGYLRETAPIAIPGREMKAPARAIPIFPAELRAPPSTRLKPRAP